MTLTLQVFLLRSWRLDVIGDRNGPRQLLHKPATDDTREQNRTVDVVDEKEGNYNKCQDKQSHLENHIDVRAIVELGAVHATVIFLIAIDVVLKVGGVHSGQKKSNLVYVLLAVVHYRLNHTDAVLGDATTRSLKRWGKDQLLLSVTIK